MIYASAKTNVVALVEKYLGSVKRVEVDSCDEIEGMLGAGAIVEKVKFAKPARPGKK